MTAPVFVDTNVLLYVRDASEPSRQPIARRWIESLWEQRTGRLSYQVLHEYYVAVTRKLKPGLPPEEARADVRDLLAWRPVPTDGPMLEDAWWLETRFGLSHWDALIVAAARAQGCRFLLTEDLSHGQDLDGTIVASPFVIEPGELSSMAPA